MCNKIQVTSPVYFIDIFLGSDVTINTGTITFSSGSVAGDNECFTITLMSDTLLEGPEVVILEASSDEAIISGIFDPLGDVPGEIDDALIFECAELNDNVNSLIECIEEIGGSNPIVHQGSTSIPLIIADEETQGNREVH